MHLPTTTTTLTILTTILSLLPPTHANLICLHPNPNPLPLQPVPISPTDCTNAIALLRTGDKSHAPIHFSRHHDTGFTVPHRWLSGSCAIALDMLRADDEDDFPLEDVAIAAEAVVARCVSGGTRYGGLVLVGPRKVVVVRVYGRKVVVGEGWGGLDVGGRNGSVGVLGTAAAAREGTAVARGFRA